MVTTWRKNGNDDGADHGDDGDEHDAGDEEGPVSGVGGAGVGDEGDAGDDGGEQREACGPAGDGAVGDEVLVGGLLTAGHPQADGDQCDEVDRDDDDVDEVHLAGGLEWGLHGYAAGGHASCETHGGFHVGGVGDVLAGDVEGGAVVDGGADDGDAEGDVDGGLEVDELHGDVALVVIHGDDEIEFAAQAADEDGVGGVGAGAVDAQLAGLFDGGGDDGGVLGAEEVVLAGVGIEAADGDAGWALQHEL